METKYENHFGESVLKNSVLMNKLTKAFNKMKSEENLFVSTDEYKGYLMQDKENKCYYLALDTGDMTTIYKDENYNPPFNKLLDGDKDSLKYYAEHMISFFNSKEDALKGEKKIEKMLSIYPENIRKELRDMIVSTMKLPEPIVRNNPFEFQMLLDFLENNNLSPLFDKDFLYKNPGLFKQVQERVPEFGIVLAEIKDALKNNSITEKNKFEYNDLDNHVWKNAQYIVSTEQNFSWVTDFIDAKNFTVYAALAAHNGHGSKAQSTTGLLKKVKSGEELNDLDYVGLRVENGKVKYANNAFMYSLDFNIMLNKDVLEEEGLLKVDYGDVDTKSFEYQFAYANKTYNISKVSFLIHALFILGNGYGYDKETGKIYSEVKYIPDLLKDFEYTETKKDTDPIKSMVYLAPPKLEYLDDQ